MGGIESLKEKKNAVTSEIKFGPVSRFLLLLTWRKSATGSGHWRGSVHIVPRAKRYYCYVSVIIIIYYYGIVSNLPLSNLQTNSIILCNIAQHLKQPYLYLSLF